MPPVGKCIPTLLQAILHSLATQTLLVRLTAASTLFLLLLLPPTTAFTTPPFNLRNPLPSSTHTSATPSPTSAAEAVSAVLPSIALVEPSGVRNITSRGSAFIVDYPPPNDATTSDKDTDNDTNPSDHIYLLTAAHVAAPGARLHVSFPPSPPPPYDSDGLSSSSSLSPERLWAEVVGRDESSDLALIRVPLPREIAARPRPTPTPLVLWDRSDVVPPLGTDAYAFGFPPGMLGDSPAVSRGIVCGIAGWPEPFRGRKRGRGRRDGRKRGRGGMKEEKEEKEEEEKVGDSGGGSDESEKGEGSSTTTKTTTTFVVTDAAMSPGMSGGPLTDSDGMVLGVCALVRMDVGGIGNYAVSAETCRRFIEGLHRRETEVELAADAVKGYRVVLFNDRMNTRKQVDYVLRDVAMLDAKDAKTVMISAHRTGRGVVRDFYVGEEDDVLDVVKERAESLCTALRGSDVLVEVEEIFSTPTS